MFVCSAECDLLCMHSWVMKWEQSSYLSPQKKRKTQKNLQLGALKMHVGQSYRINKCKKYRHLLLQKKDTSTPQNSFVLGSFVWPLGRSQCRFSLRATPVELVGQMNSVFGTAAYSTHSHHCFLLASNTLLVPVCLFANVSHIARLKVKKNKLHNRVHSL